MPNNTESPQDEDDLCPYPHRFSEAWAQFKLGVVDQASNAKSATEVACVKFPYAAGYAAAIGVVAHMLDVSGNAGASFMLNLLVQDAAEALRKAEQGLPEKPITEPSAAVAPVAPNGTSFH